MLNDVKREALRNQIKIGFFEKNPGFEDAILAAFELENHPKAHNIYEFCSEHVSDSGGVQDYFTDIFELMYDLTPLLK